MAKSLGRVLTISLDSFKEIVLHNRWFQLCLLGLLCFVFGAQSLGNLPLGSSSPKLLFDLGQGGLMIGFGVMLAFMLAVQVNSDLEGGTIQVYLVRGLARSEYQVGKVFGSWLAVMCGVVAATLLLAMLVTKELTEIGDQGIAIHASNPWLWLQLILFYAVQFFTLASLVALFLSISRSFLFPVVLSLLLWMVSLFINGTSDFAEPSVGLVGYLTPFFQAILPRFDLMNVADRLWYSGALDLPSLSKAIGFESLYGAVLLAAAILLFKRREL